MPPSKIALRWKSVYVFISSTFNDMHAERDYLVKQVFPDLREWCEKRKLRLVDIDLRWGVTEQDATQNSVVQVCLENIDKCRPFFLCFLGQRRGWVPGNKDISGATYAEYPELSKYVGAASVTEMEILHALINPLHRSRPRQAGDEVEHFKPSKYAFFYLRQPEYLANLPADLPQLNQVYTNAAIKKIADRQEADKQLVRWREVEIPATHRPMHLYHADWDPGEHTPEIHFPLQYSSTNQPGSHAWQTGFEKWARQWAEAGIGLDASGEISAPGEIAAAARFNERLTQGRLRNFTCAERSLAGAILADLQSAIQERYPDHLEVAALTPLQSELDQQEQFLQSACEGYVERKGDFVGLDEYVQGTVDQPFVLSAPGGMGKTSLLARWIDRLTLDQSAGETLHYRFIGASDGSTTVDDLLRSLLHEIQEVGGKLSDPPPADPINLRACVPALLEAAGKKGRTIIVLDGLNQLESKLSDLAWLPLKLPANVRLIVSFKRGEPAAEGYYQQLQSGQRAILAKIQPFETLDDRRVLVNAYLSQYLKSLDKSLLDALIETLGAANPLYLKVVLSELRVFGAYADLGSKIRGDFGDTPATAFGAVLARLENDAIDSPLLPRELVPLIFGALAHARHGLSVDELVDILAANYPGSPAQEKGGPDPQVWKEDIRQAIYVYLRQMRPFLAHRLDRTDYLYESMREAATVRYAGGPRPGNQAAQVWHARLAGCFQRRCLLLSAHALAELPYHLAQAGRLADLDQLLTAIPYLEERCRLGNVYDLIEDYHYLDTPGHTRSADSGEYESFLKLHAQVLDEFHDLFFTLAYAEGPAPVQSAAHRLADRGPRRYPWLRLDALDVPSRPVADTSQPEGTGLTITGELVLKQPAHWANAQTANLVFFSQGLAQLGMADLKTLRILPVMIPCQRSRVLRLVAAPDGHLLAAAYENGTLDLFRIHLAADGSYTGHETLASTHYLLPESEAPELAFFQGRLWYQARSGQVESIGPPDSIPRPTPQPIDSIPLRVDPPGELSGIARTGDWIAFTFRLEGHTWIHILRDYRWTDEWFISDAEVQGLCAEGERLALALTNMQIVVYEIVGDSVKRTAMKTSESPAGITWTRGVTGAGELVFEQGNKLYRWLPIAGELPSSLDMQDNPTIRGARLTPGLDGSLWVATEYCLLHAIDRRFGLPTASSKEMDLRYIYPCKDSYLVVSADACLCPGKKFNQAGGQPASIELPVGVNAAFSAGYNPVNGIFMALSTSGEGSLVGVETMTQAAFSNAPRQGCCVASDPAGGFWVADLQGLIYYGRVSTVSGRPSAIVFDGPLADVNMRGYLGSDIRSKPTIHRCPNSPWLTWQAECEYPVSPLDHPAVGMVVFYRVRVQDGKPVLDKVGERAFTRPGERMVEASTYWPKQDQFLFVLQHSVHSGSAGEFVREAESSFSLANRNYTFTSASADAGNAGLFLRDSRGYLHYAMSGGLGSPRMGYAGLSPVTGLASYSDENQTLIIVGNTRIYRCQFERSRL